MLRYLVTFIEGFITFVSPCLLPMLPLYISYFAGGEKNTKKALWGSVGFVSGFTLVFVALGALASTLGAFVKQHQIAVNIISGAVVIFFGLNFLGVLKIKLFGGIKKDVDTSNMGFLSALLFGIVFAIGWTPCVGTFLGAALMLAAQAGHLLEGMLLLLIYSLGLGIPFILSAVLIDYLKGAFNWIKKNYEIINKISGAFLILIGVLMATGLMNKFTGLFS